MKAMLSMFTMLNKRRRGSTLILALVLTTVLFILGIVFVTLARMERVTIEYVKDEKAIDNAVETVIQRIHEVLTDDLFGNNTERSLLDGLGDLDGATNEDEPADYPGPNDYWLASLEPDMLNDGSGNNFAAWRHITDLWHDNFDIQQRSDDDTVLPLWTWPLDRQYNGMRTNAFYRTLFSVDNGPVLKGGADARLNRWLTAWTELRQFKHTPAILLPKNSPVQVDRWDPANLTAVNPLFTIDWGGLADADGDGVSDARWTRIPGQVGPQGEDVLVAVRIIDHGGMINLNTAYKNPEINPAAGTPRWDGSRQTDVNLNTCNSGGLSLWGIQNEGADTTADTRLTLLHNVRAGQLTTASAWPDPDQYQLDLACRVFNPDRANPTAAYPYKPFDTYEELDLRFGFLLNPQDSVTYSRLESTVWPKTFNAFSGLRQNYPFYVDMNPASYLNWYSRLNNAGPTDPIYDRRHIVTTLNVDRLLAPYVNLGANSSAAVEGNRMPKALWDAWKNRRDPAGQPRLHHPVALRNLHTGTPGEQQQKLRELAAAIWLSLPEGSVLNNLPWLKGLGWNADQARERVACQMAVNLRDYLDPGDEVYTFAVADDPAAPPSGSNRTDFYYGFEYNAPRLAISQLAVAYYLDQGDVLNLADDIKEEHYAIELFNPGPQPVTIAAGEWVVTVKDGQDFPIPALPVLNAGDSLILTDSTGAGHPFSGASGAGSVFHDLNAGFKFVDNDAISLRYIKNGNVIVDSCKAKADTGAFPSIPTASTGTAKEYYLQRTIRVLQYPTAASPVCQLPVWEQKWLGSWIELPVLQNLATTAVNRDGAGTFIPIDLECLNGPPATVAQLYQALALGGMRLNVADTQPASGTMETMPEFWERIRQDNNPDKLIAKITDGRIDGADTSYADLIRYASVFRPFDDGVDNDGNGSQDNTDINHELSVSGRININTAPWFVIAQLPWIQDPALGLSDVNKYKLAQAIVAYRDKTGLYANPAVPEGDPKYGKGRKTGMGNGAPDVREETGFQWITELLDVTNDYDGTGSTYDPYACMRRYGRDSVDNNEKGVTGPVGPFYQEDNLIDDVYERTILFNRISNLITTRSDVFTAYILVRIGQDGPQKRVMAIFDRSKVFTGTDKPRLVAIQEVPDAR